FTEGGLSLAPAIEANIGHLEGGTMFLRGFGGMHLDDISFGGGASENALVFDYNSMQGIGAAATAGAGLNPLVTTTPAHFLNALPTVAWRMVTLDNPSNTFDADTSSAIAKYVDGGGRVHMSYWNLDADPLLQEAFGVESATDFFDPRPVFAVGAHESWGGLTEV